MKKFLKNNKLAIGILFVVIIFAIIYSMAEYIIDYMWFKELGYVSAFFKKIITQAKIGAPVFVLVTLISYVYFKLIKKSYFKLIISEEIENSKLINRISWGLGAVLGLGATWFVTSRLWFSFLQFSNSTSFGYDDPLFGLDVSFYIFKLDFLKALNGFAAFMLLIYIVLTVVYYFALIAIRPPRVFKSDNGGFDEPDRFNERAEGESNEKEYESGFEFKNFNGTKFFSEKFARVFSASRKNKNRKSFDNENIKNLFTIASKQLMIAGSLIFLMIAASFVLKQFDLLHTHTGAVYGAGYTDVKVTLWVYRVCAAIAVAGAILVVIGIKKHRLKYIAISPLLIVAVMFGGTLVEKSVQSIVVSPNEISKESPYLERNIEYTQKAYGLDDIDIKSFAAENNLTSQDIKNNDATISNIRINDYIPTEKFYNQTQSIRQYYTFKDVDVDRYTINGEYTQTFSSAREIDEDKISQTWLNKHLKYTHGYGVTLSRVDAVTASGQPEVLIKDIPPKSNIDGITVKRPEIYFGEITKDYAIVGADEDEFDYPDGDSNKYTRYEGKAGIKLNLFNRVLFAIKEKSFKILVSSNINSDSKIIINRSIKDRVKKIMPYLEYDSEPYMIIENGKLYWIMDAYTTSENFPYSEPYKMGDKNVNYVRNSVKVVIDAYNGDVDYYVVDEKDPIAATFKKIYPKLFKNFDEMPEGIRSHIRYPNALFATQAKVYSRYHMNDVRVFYQNEDLWDIAKEIYGTEEKTMTPSYYIMNLPGENKAEFVNTIPFTPKDKKNMTGIMVARNDGANYGKLVLYKLPKNKVVYGPRQIEAQIDQDPEISKEFSLWNSAGSKYSRGNMFVIPIEESLLYVEPVYLEASESSIPEVKRVIVAYGDKIAYEKTLAEALNKLFGEGSRSEESSASAEGDKSSSSTDSNTSLIRKANEAFSNATEAQKRGDWAKYGEYMKELEGYLNKLK